MKVSLNTAQQFSNVELSPDGVDELIKKVGLQLGAVESVTKWGQRYDGIVVAKVSSVKPHPNADKLKVCLIDDGGVASNVARNNEGLIELVCGADNVSEGQSIAYIPPGAVVPETFDTDNFILEAKEIRGIVSNGMIASAKELGIGSEHNGILVIEDVDLELTKPGTQFKKLYGLDDTVIDLENKMFTHRPDGFGILGVARELAGIQGKQFVSPDWYLQPKSIDTNQDTEQLHLEVEVQSPELVPRFMAVAIDGVTIKPSPVWMQATLSRLGVKPVNNIVDITNFLTHLTAQPMHAYDYEKVAGLSNGTTKLVARLAKEGESATILGGKELKLDPETLVIATVKAVVGIGGVMGGANTEVSADTKNIILEAANFDMYSIRKTAMKYGLFTDAATRFTKNQSPLQIDRVISYAITQIQEIAGGVQAGPLIDVSQTLNQQLQIKFDSDFVNNRLGSTFSAQDMASILKNVEFDVQISGSELNVKPPFWRTDIAIAEDLVEEIGRLHGYGDLPVYTPLRNAKPTNRSIRFDFEQRIRNGLAAAGASEVLTYSFVHRNLLESVGQEPDLAFSLRNAISPDLHYYRLSLMPSLLELVHPNLKAGNGHFALFEINSTHNKNDLDDTGLPKETLTLALVVAASDKDRPSDKYGTAFYWARAYLDELARITGSNFQFEAATLDEQYAKPFNTARTALVKSNERDQELGLIGEFKQSVKTRLKLPYQVAGFEVKLDPLIAASNGIYEPLSRYPVIHNDLTLAVDQDTPHQTVFNSLVKAASQQKSTIKIRPVDIFSSPKSPQKHLTFRVSFQQSDRTMTQDEANQAMKEIIEPASKVLQITQV